jgi:hypothetical protein
MNAETPGIEMERIIKVPRVNSNKASDKGSGGRGGMAIPVSAQDG